MVQVVEADILMSGLGAESARSIRPTIFSLTLLPPAMLSLLLPQVVEANILMSGLGAESAGLAGAHALHNGISELPESHKMLHGEKVAFGTLCQLMIEGDKEEAVRVARFCRQVREVWGAAGDVAVAAVVVAVGGGVTADRGKLLGRTERAAQEDESLLGPCAQALPCLEHLQ